MTDAAPQHVHDELDKHFGGVLWGRRIGMGAQVIMSIDAKGNVRNVKVNLSSNGDVAKNGAPA